MADDLFDGAEILADILGRAKSVSAIERYLNNEYGFLATERGLDLSALAKDIYALGKEANTLPMEYFEAKTYRAFPFSEAAGIVVPDTLPKETQKKLSDLGANVLTYKDGDNEDRLRVVNGIAGARFSSESYPSDEWAESLSRSKEFAVRFTGGIDTNGFVLGSEEFGTIQHSLKNGNGKISRSGSLGCITSANFAYEFVVQSDDTVRIIDVDVSEGYSILEERILERFVNGNHRRNDAGSSRDEEQGSGSYNDDQYGVSSSEARDGIGHDGLYPRDPYVDSRGNRSESHRDGGKPSIRDAKVKPFKSYVSVAKIKEKLKYGFPLKDSEKAILDSKGISYPADNSKTRYSSEIDSAGNALTEAQAEFFKDSKVRDENGNLLVMYHGTENAGFTVFNPEYSSNDGSIFFTSSRAVAKTYSGTSDVYENKKFESAEELTEYIRDYMRGDDEYSVEFQDGEYVLLDNGEFAESSDDINDIFGLFLEYSGYGGDSANYMVYLNATNPLIIDGNNRNWDSLIAEEEGTTNYFAEYAKENGYDGVIFKGITDIGLYSDSQEKQIASTVVAVFNSNQIKLVSNLNPTAADDIRFSKETTSIAFDAAEHTEKEKRVFAEYLGAMDPSVAAFAQKYIENHKLKNERHMIAPVSNRVARRVSHLLGKDFSGYSFAINGSSVVHIDKRHGENGIADASMRHVEDLARIGWVMNNPDSLSVLQDHNGSPVLASGFLNSTGKNAELVMFEKKLDGTYACAVAMTDGKYKKLWVVTAFLVNKKSAITRMLNTDLSALSFTAKTAYASLVLSNESIQETGENVNTEDGVRYSREVSGTDAMRFVDAFYTRDTVKSSIADFVVEANRKWLLDQFDAGRYYAIAKTLSEHTGISENDAWNKLAPLLLKKEGVAKYDGKTFASITELSEKSLRKALELGGFAAPSIGIVDLDNPSTGFGDITFIFPSWRFNADTDPTFDGDAGTESFPAVANFTRTDFADALLEDFPGAISEEDAWQLNSYLENLSFIEEGQRTEHDIFAISYASVYNMVHDWDFRSVSLLHDLYKSVRDDYADYDSFLTSFVEKYFTNKRMFRGDSLPDWLQLDPYVRQTDGFNRMRFKEYDLDNAVEIMTANERKAFFDANQIEGDAELTSEGMRAKLKYGGNRFFEMKPQRAVYFDDASYVVAPSTVSQDIVDELHDFYGVKVVTYDRENNEGQADAVRKILQGDAFGDIRFSNEREQGDFTIASMQMKLKDTAEYIAKYNRKAKYWQSRTELCA